MRALAVPAACILLAACGGGDAENDQRTASGQVLEGSISDSMLPLETVRSEPPLAKVTGTPGPVATATALPEADATTTPEDGATPAAAASAAPREVAP
jgi:hypothetical protein